jgi:hypothetical protein
MIDTQTVHDSILPVGAKAGQILLLVDLTQTPQPMEALALIQSMGYQPQLKFCIFSTGLHVVAVLKEEQFDPRQAIDDEYLMEEWSALEQSFNSDAVKLWRGQPQNSGG